jgi:hypothetical protein
MVIVFRNQLPRLYELRDLAANTRSKNAYFQNFEDRLPDPQILRFYSELERDLDGLDNLTWESLKDEAAPRFTARHPDLGWTQLFDILRTQARAYNYLKRIGCSGVRFIPRVPNSRTPDLEARTSGEGILCEAKTLNVSIDSIRARRAISVRNGLQTGLPKGFFKKLQYQISQAEAQMIEYDTLRRSRHVVYIFPRFDDLFGECKPSYFSQIDEYLRTNPTRVEIVIYNDRTPFYQPLTMTTATVDNAA